MTIITSCKKIKGNTIGNVNIYMYMCIHIVNNQRISFQLFYLEIISTGL